MFQDLFEICGGDRSSGLMWQSLKTANLGFNGLTRLDSSLVRCSSTVALARDDIVCLN